MTTDASQLAPSAHERWVRLDGDDGDGAIDGFELSSARRALALLKRRLGRARLLELLEPEIAAGDAFLRDHLARSAGQEATGTTVLRAHGITARQFGGWLGQAFAREDVMLAGHPEHYSIHGAPGRNVNIVETLGDQVCSFFMQDWDEAVVPDQPRADAQEAGAPTRRSRILLEDGTVVGSIANTFQDAEDGFTARLSVTLPATCEPEVIDQHLEHFAVEFRTWILRAASEAPSASE
jgi:hypothetical protein